jgi:hypothetical protein
MRSRNKIDTTLRLIARYFLAACLLAAVFLSLTGNVTARNSTVPRKVELLFVGGSNALLEPCG